MSRSALFQSAYPDYSGMEPSGKRFWRGVLRVLLTRRDIGRDKVLCRQRFLRDFAWPNRASIL
jgi:hypothetical protein